MELIALLSTGKGSWNEVSSVIDKGEWDKIILIGNEFAKKFNAKKQSEFVQIDMNKDVELLSKELTDKLKGKIQNAEVALNIASGSGKEHVALISALLSVPVGIKFVSSTEKGFAIL